MNLRRSVTRFDLREIDFFFVLHFAANDRVAKMLIAAMFAGDVPTSPSLVESVV